MISIPPGLRGLALALWLCLPVAILETALVSRSPLARVPPERLLDSAGGAAIACSLLGLPVLFAWRPAWRLATGIFATWIGVTAWMAFRDRNFPLALLGAILPIFQLLYIVWLRVEHGRSFYDPGVKWYHGSPRPIPGLHCDLGTSDPFRVSALDRQGIFVYREAGGSAPEWIGVRQPREITLSFRDQRVSCRCIPVRSLHRDGIFRGVGLRFSGMSPDARKRLGDFVETLKGEGYVQ